MAEDTHVEDEVAPERLGAARGGRSAFRCTRPRGEGKGGFVGRMGVRRSSLSNDQADDLRGTLACCVITCMSIADGHWYTSAGFWNPASSLIVTLLIGIVTVWVTIRAAYPKRQLTYTLRGVTSLLNSEHVSGLKVMHDGAILTDPYVLRLVVRNGGRRDISRDAFDGGEPLRFDVDAPIVERLSVTMQPSDQQDPRITVDGCVLVIDPVKISQGETISVTALVDGKPTMQHPKQSLIDVKIRPQPDNDRRLSVAVVGGVVALATPPVLWSVVSVILAHASVPKHTAFTLLDTEGVLIFGALIIFIWLRRPPRRR